MDKMFTSLRDATPDSKSGTNVKETSQLKGEAKDSLEGKNVTKQHETTFGEKGKLGAQVESNG